MLRKMKVLTIVGVALLIAILFLIYGTPKYQSMKLKNENFGDLVRKLKEEVNVSSEIDIKQLTDFDWDEFYIFPPYYPAEAIYEKVGEEWTTTRTYIEFLLFHGIENQAVSEGQYVIVFKKDSRVILAEEYNLNDLPVIFKPDNYKFESSNAKFYVSAAKEYVDGKIKELSLKE